MIILAYLRNVKDAILIGNSSLKLVTASFHMRAPIIASDAVGPTIIRPDAEAFLQPNNRLLVAAGVTMDAEGGFHRRVKG